MLATGRGIAVVRRASPKPANDNNPASVTPDDGPFFLALGLICVGILALVVYLALSGSDNVMTALRR